MIKPFERNELVINVASALRRRSLELASRASHAELERLVTERTQEGPPVPRRADPTPRVGRRLQRPETASHLRRMSLYSELLGRLAGLDEHRCELLRLAAPMHDIGKIGIPDEILTKPTGTRPTIGK